MLKGLHTLLVMGNTDSNMWREISKVKKFEQKALVTRGMVFLGFALWVM